MPRNNDNTLVQLYLFGVLTLMFGILVLLEGGYLFSFFFAWSPVIAGFVSDGLPGRIYLFAKIVIGLVLMGLIARYPAWATGFSRLAFLYAAFLLVDSMLTTTKFNPGASLIAPLFVAFFLCAGSLFWYHMFKDTGEKRTG